MNRRVSWAVALGGALLFLVAAALLVPWSPVPGGVPDPVPASEVFTDEQLSRANAYADTQRVLSWGALALSLVVSCVLGFTRLGGRLLGRKDRHWIVMVVGLTAVVTLLGSLFSLPLSAVLRERSLDAGLSTQSWGDWLLDQAKNYAVTVVIASLALLVLIGCARRWRTWWPAIAGGLCAGLVLAASYLHPVVVEPLFGSFDEMAAGNLRTEILTLAEREEVPVQNVVVTDASTRTTSLNAYVSGFGSTRRVVVFDNLLESQPEDQVLAVVAHELAHAKHADVLVGTTLGALGVLTGVGVLGLVMSSGAVRRRAGVAGTGDPRSVALLLALAALATVLTSPIQSTISRQIETRADVDALAVTDSAAMVGLQRDLCLRSLCDPDGPGWSQFWFGTHPTVLDRVAIAEQVDPG